MIRIEMIWLALGASDLRGGIDVLLAQVLRGFAGGAQAHHAWRRVGPLARRGLQGCTSRAPPWQGAT